MSHARIAGSMVLRSYRKTATFDLISLKDFTRGFADVVTGLNVSKGGVDPPVKPDEEYPEWLWELCQPERTLGDLRRLNKADLDFHDMKRLGKLENRSKIRQTNIDKAK